MGFNQYFFQDLFWAFLPLIDTAVKSGTGDEREKRWGVDRRNDNGPDSNQCPPWASSQYVVGATACATVPPINQYFDRSVLCSLKADSDNGNQILDLITTTNKDSNKKFNI